MAEPPRPDQWAELRRQRPLHDDALATLPISPGGADSGPEFGMDRLGDLHLLLPVVDGPSGSKPPDLQGLKVRHRHIPGGRQLLDLSSSACHERLFSPLCGEILTAVLDRGRDPWEAVAAILRAWQSAWRPASLGMDKVVQVGLFGELLTLERVVIPAIGPGAIHHWSGPDSERHDFVGARLHMEVKTTRKGRHEHEISRLDQLHAPAGRNLIVASILLEESAAGTETIATKMDQITDLIREDPEASDQFQVKMFKLGWSEELRRSGELLRFHLGDSLLLPVDQQFPRFPDDFALPSGIVAVRYTVVLANLPAMDITEAIQAVRTGF